MPALKIAFIGTGTMGKPMTMNLIKAGYTLNVYNRTKEKTKELVEMGATVCESPAKATENSDVIITCVSNDVALDNVLFSNNGVFQALNESKILIDSGTTSVDFTSKIADECKKMNVAFLDAPVTGGRTGAENGALMFMVGGSRETLDKCMPIFSSMGKRIVHCGGNTFGQKAKIALNLTQSLTLQSYFEGIILGLRNGVPLDSMLEIFENSGAKSGVGSSKLPNILKRDFTPHFKLELMNKDVGLAIRESEKLNLDLPLSRELAKVFQEAMDKGWKEEDFACLVKLLEEKSGVVLKSG